MFVQDVVTGASGGTAVPDSAIRPVAPPASLRAHVEQALSAAIVSGELAPRTLLTVPTLAERFAVSATPVREAMLDLHKRGFVEPVRNKGFLVTEVSERELTELVACRRMLECPAMAELAGHLADIDRFRGLADRIVAGAEQGDLRAYLEADLDFHLGLLGQVGNRLLVDLVRELRSRTRLVGLAGLLRSQRLRHSAEEHHRLLDLLHDGDAEGAQALMYAHIGHIVGWWSGRPEGTRPNDDRTTDEQANAEQPPTGTAP